jgi:acyl CoA:acetate/3-ketoacid CoA transferase
LKCDVLGQAGFPLRVSKNLVLMDKRIFQPEPFGLKLNRRS